MNRRDMVKEIEQYAKTSGDTSVLDDLKNLTDDELTAMYEHLFLKEAGDKTGGME